MRSILLHSLAFHSAFLYSSSNASLTTVVDSLLGDSLLAPVLNPFAEVLDLILDGTGLIDGVLGGLKGVLGQDDTFDYVVVGGGTAGLAIGTRLAQGGHSVAIIEAGLYYEIGKPVLGTTPVGDIIGIGSSILDSDPLVDWQFLTEPQAGAAGRRIHYARGKCLGGSSALNFMIYQRGTKESFEEWAKLVNDSSYTWDNVLPYFEKSVTFTPPNTNARLANATTLYDDSVFQQAGPVSVGYTNYISVFSTIMSKALQMVGLPNIDGFNSGKLIGSSYCSSTIRSKDQTRSTSTAYIKGAKDLDNLKVYTQTLAEKILFDSEKHAIGVEVQSLGLPYTIHASKEVIVSAGAFQSPQLLMVSGIGPRETLESLDIEIISERPGVGQNMWDHILFGPSYEMSIKTLSEVLKNPTVLGSELLKYITKAEGVLTSPVVDFIGWEKIPAAFRKFSESTTEDLSQFPSDWPEVEIISGQGYIGNFTFPVVDQLIHGRLDQQFATILGALVAPTSRGNVTIKSKHTTDLPLVNPNWLTTKTDQEVAVALYKRIRHIFQTAALQEVVIGEEIFPGIGTDNDEEILSVIQNSLQTVWHAACTCSMGASDNPLAVLDSDAKVYGVQGLRVVDASSFPLLPPGHPQSAVYMLAEKIADSILRA